MLQSPCDFGRFGPVPPPRGHDHRHVQLSCLCESQCAGSRSLLEAPPQASNRQHPAGLRGQLGQLYDPATNTSLLPRQTSPKERASFARGTRIRNMTSSTAWLVPWKHIMMHAAASALKCMLTRAGHMICNGRPQTELHASPFVWLERYLKVRRRCLVHYFCVALLCGCSVSDRHFQGTLSFVCLAGCLFRGAASLLHRLFPKGSFCVFV